MKKWIFFLLILISWAVNSFKSFSQDMELRRVVIDGKAYPVLISGGDTMIIADLKEVTVKSTRLFASKEEEALYYKYRRYAVKVYPYAVEAIRIFRGMEEKADNMKRRERKRYIKQMQEQLKNEFEEPLKNLSKTQGMILVKMIEKEQERSMYDLVKGVKGGFTATYWNTFGYFYGYRLKRPYEEGDDPILDMVLKDFNISYDVDNPDFKLPENYKASGSKTTVTKEGKKFGLGR
ncbi:MAG: DUF4294 domain-containing protein [Saprospiraceae bacterium]|nr:DUF4294 domain-containing protein [Saprospiraceae bacterium]